MHGIAMHVNTVETIRIGPPDPNHRTHLQGAQGHVQLKWMGSRAAQVR